MCKLDESERPHLRHTRQLKLVHVNGRLDVRKRTERAFEPLRRPSLGKPGPV
jgi:hypothetical protein